EFISKLAKSNGFEFFVRGETLNFRSPGNASTPAVTLKWGESLSAFSPEENLTRQVSAVEVRHWDAKTKKEIIGRAKKGAEHGRDPRKKSGGDLIESIAGEAAIEIIRKPVFSKDEADREARAALDKFAEGLITGTGHCIGIPDIRAGETIALEGIGKKFSGTYYVQKAVHTLDSSGYRTTFTVQRNTI
ncbi:MAG: phage late control D family protein, partial [Halobacteriota archaeon]